MSKLIVVIGITGNQGGSVGQVFLKEPGWRVRGITRDPSRPSNDTLRAAGVELVAADLDDPASLEAAFRGANAIFAVTDFWQFFGNPEVHKAAAEAGKTPNKLAEELEIQQGKNIADAAAKTLHTLERFVLSTLSDSKKWSNGKITWNHHFDGKAVITEYVKSIPTLAAKSSYLQVGMYMDNWKNFPLFSPQKQPDGTFILFKTGIPNGHKLPFVHPPTDTGHFVRALVLAAPAGKTLLGTSDLLFLDEWATLWSRILNKKMIVKLQTMDEIIKAAGSEGLGREVGESGFYVSEYGWAGGDPDVVLPKDVGVELDKLTTAEQYIRSQDWSKIL